MADPIESPEEFANLLASKCYANRWHQFDAAAAIRERDAAVREAALREAIDLVREEERHAEANAQEWLKNRGPRSPLVSRAGSVAQAKRDSRKALEKLLTEKRTP